MLMLPDCIAYSYLKSLLPSFNKCVDVLLDSIRPLADGETDVPMKQHLAECTLYVISKVSSLVHYCITFGSMVRILLLYFQGCGVNSACTCTLLHHLRVNGVSRNNNHPGSIQMSVP